MTKLTIEVAAQYIKEFVLEHDLDIPNSIEEYDELVGFMRTLHRATLSNNGIKCQDLIKLINPAYIAGSAKSILGYTSYVTHAQTVGLSLEKVDSNIPDSEFTRKHLLRAVCDNCGWVDTITAASLIRRANGCKRCLGTTKWEHREDEFINKCIDKNVMPTYTTYEGVPRSKALEVKCITCSTAFTRAFSSLIADKYPIDCPMCSPPRVFGSLGKSNIYNGIEFDSQIECEVYKLLESSSKVTSIEVHVPYSKLSNTHSLFNADFVINNCIVLEVSTFNRKHHPVYYARLDAKEVLIRPTKYKFVFYKTLAEVNTLINAI
jgi:DNA-directed RNA polymerase subunit RPC12/RpoP